METRAVLVGWFIWQTGWRMSSGNHGEDWKFKSVMQLFNCVQVTLLQSVKRPKMSSTVHRFCGTSCKWYLKTVRTLESKSTVQESAHVEMILFGCDYTSDTFVLHYKIFDFKMQFIVALRWRKYRGQSELTTLLYSKDVRSIWGRVWHTKQSSQTQYTPKHLAALKTPYLTKNKEIFLNYPDCGLCWKCL